MAYEIKAADSYAGSPELHKKNISDYYQQLTGQTLNPAQLEAWAGLSGDFNQIKGFLNSGFRDPSQTPLAQQKNLKEAQGAYAPLMEAQNRLTQQQFDTLKKNIGLRKEEAIRGVGTTLAGRGLERSSEMARGAEKIEQAAMESLNAADIQQTIQQAQNTLQNWQNVTGSAGQLQQTQFNQNQQAFQNAISGQAAALQNIGFPVQQYSTVAELYRAFLQSGTQIPPWIYEGLQQSLNKLGN